MSEAPPVLYRVMEQLYGASRGDWSQPAHTDTPCWLRLRDGQAVLYVLGDPGPHMSAVRKAVEALGQKAPVMTFPMGDRRGRVSRIAIGAVPAP